MNLGLRYVIGNEVEVLDLLFVVHIFKLNKLN